MKTANPQCIEPSCVWPACALDSGRCLPHAREESVIQGCLDAWRAAGRPKDIEPYEPHSLEARLGEWPSVRQILRVFSQCWVEHEEDAGERRVGLPFRIRDTTTPKPTEVLRRSKREYERRRRELVLQIPEMHEVEKKKQRARYAALSPEQKREQGRKNYQARLRREGRTNESMVR